MMLVDEVRVRGIVVDCERVLRMALLHDWAEARVGDMPKTATGYFGAEIRRRAETLAFADIVSGLGAAADYKDIHHDYEERSSLEARLVKAADVIDLLVQAYALEHSGSKGLDEFWQVIHEADFKLPAIAEGVVREVLQSLLEARSQIK
jgi:putative hydrolase of HD superfamily